MNWTLSTTHTHTHICICYDLYTPTITYYVKKNDNSMYCLELTIPGKHQLAKNDNNMRSMTCKRSSEWVKEFHFPYTQYMYIIFFLFFFYISYIEWIRWIDVNRPIINYMECVFMLYVTGYCSACARHVVTCMYVRVHVHVSVVVDVLCC